MRGLRMNAFRPLPVTPANDLPLFQFSIPRYNQIHANDKYPCPIHFAYPDHSCSAKVIRSKRECYFTHCAAWGHVDSVSVAVWPGCPSTQTNVWAHQSAAPANHWQYIAAAKHRHSAQWADCKTFEFGDENGRFPQPQPLDNITTQHPLISLPIPAAQCRFYTNPKPTRA